MKLARYGPDPKYGYGIPEAGFCISAFALVREQGERDKILLLKAKEHKVWLNDWSSFGVFKDQFPERYERLFSKWMFPCAYLYEGEHPDAALGRILNQQLGLSKFKVAYPGKLEVFYDPSDWYPGKKHLDFCFVYDVETPQKMPSVKKLPWISEMKFINPNGLSQADIASVLGDLAKRLQLI